MEVSVSLFSFNRWFRENKLTVKECLDFCGSVPGLAAVDLLSYYWRDPDHEVPMVRDWLTANHLKLSSYGIGNNFAQGDQSALAEQLSMAKKGVDVAASLQAPCIRIFGGGLKKGSRHHDPSWGVWNPTTAGKSKNELMQAVIDSLKELSSYAASKGVVLGMENHGLFIGPLKDVNRVLDEVNSPYLQAIVDLGNFLQIGDDPFAAIRTLHGKMVRVQLKDIRKPNPAVDNLEVMEYRRFGEGDMDLRGYIKGLKEVGYDGYLCLEVEFEGQDDTAEMGADVRHAVAHVNNILASVGG